MSEHVDEVVEEVPTPDAPVPDHAPVPDPPADEAHASHDEMRPGFVDEILDRIDSVVEMIKGDPVSEVAPIVEPDESPVRPPWTHRSLFGKR